MAGQYPPNTPIYIVGDKGLHDALAAHGFRAITPADVRAGATAAFVVVGFTPHATYEDLAMGSLLVHRGTRFIGTNPDPSYPSELGPLPGAGALLAVITTATGVEPLLMGASGGDKGSRKNARRRRAGQRSRADWPSSRALSVAAATIVYRFSTHESVDWLMAGKSSRRLGNATLVIDRLRLFWKEHAATAN